MAKKFSERVAQMSPESRARSDARYRQLLAEMPLQALRKALDLTQQQVAASLGINPVAISKMEGQTRTCTIRSPAKTQSPRSPT